MRIHPYQNNFHANMLFTMENHSNKTAINKQQNATKQKTYNPFFSKNT